MSSIAEIIGSKFAELHNINLESMCDSFDESDAKNLIQSKEKFPSSLIPDPPRYDGVQKERLEQNGERIYVTSETSGIDDLICMDVYRVTPGGWENKWTSEKEETVLDENGKPVMVKDSKGNLVEKKQKVQKTFHKREGYKQYLSPKEEMKRFGSSEQVREYLQSIEDLRWKRDEWSQSLQSFWANRLTNTSSKPGTVL